MAALVASTADDKHIMKSHGYLLRAPGMQGPGEHDAQGDNDDDGEHRHRDGHESLYACARD